MESSLNKPRLPVDRGWAWWVLVGYFVNVFIVISWIRSLAILLPIFLDKYQQSTAMTTLAFGISELVESVGHIVIALFFIDRFSVRSLSFFGAVGNISAIISLCLAPNIVLLNVAFGVIGFARAFLLNPQIYLLGFYFNNRLSFASAVGTTGLSMATLVAPLLTQWFLTLYGLDGTFFMFGGLAAHSLIASLLFRPTSLYSTVDSNNVSDSRIQGKLSKPPSSSSSSSFLSPSTVTADEEVCYIGAQVTRNCNGISTSNENETPCHFRSMEINKIQNSSQDAPYREKKLSQSRYALQSLSREQCTNSEVKPHHLQTPNAGENEYSCFVTSHYLDNNKRIVTRNQENTIDCRCSTFDEPYEYEPVTHSQLSTHVNRLKENHLSLLLENNKKSCDDFGLEVESKNDNRCNDEIYIYDDCERRVCDDELTSLVSNEIDGNNSTITTMDDESNRNTTKADRSAIGDVCDEDDHHDNHDHHDHQEQSCCCFKKIDACRVLTNPTAVCIILAGIVGTQTQCGNVYMPVLGLENGLSSDQLPWLLMIAGVSDIIGKMFFGFVADRKWMQPINLTCLALFNAGVVFQLVSYFQGMPAMIVLCIVFGLNGGIMQSLLSPIAVEYVGLSSLPHIVSGFFLGNCIMTFVAHLVVGTIKDLTGSFKWGFRFVGALMLSGMIFLLIARWCHLSKSENRGVILCESCKSRCLCKEVKGV